MHDPAPAEIGSTNFGPGSLGSADKDNNLDRLVSRQRIEMCPHDLDQVGRKRVASLRPVENEFGNPRLNTKQDDVAAIRLHLSVAR